MPALRHEIVGRDDELAALMQFVEQLERDPQDVVLEGEPGIGKTVLWRHTLDRATSAAVLVLAASPSEAEAPLAFSGLRDLLDRAYDEVADGLPPPQRRALEVALLRSDPTDGSLDQGAVAAAFLGTLRALAERSPVLVCVDDVQWLDEPSLYVLNFASRRLREERVSFLVALRAGSAAVDLWPDARDQARISLRPLSVGALHRIIRTQLGTSPSRPALVRIHELSGGNPFFALEIARALERRGAEQVRHELAIPSRLQDLVSERLRGLPPETVAALEVAAALSQPTVAVVTEAIGDGAALDAAVGADVISTVGDRIAFSHPLLASTAYAGAGPVRRREVHRRLAALVDNPEEQARHLALATTGPDSEVAAALERAADRARARGASTVAAGLAEQAHDLTPETATADRLRRALFAGGNLFDAGDAAAAAALLERAVAIAPPGPARAEALSELGRAYGFAADLRAAAAVYRQSIAESEPASRTRADAEHGLAVALMRLLEDLQASVRHAQTAVEVAAKLEDARAAEVFRATLALVRRLLGDAVEKPRYSADPAAAASGRWAFMATINGPEFMRAVLAVFADDPTSARAGLRRALALATERGDEASLPLVLRYLSFVELLTGDWDRADKLAGEGYEAALLTGQRPQQAVIAATKALIAAHRGDAVATRRDATEALRLVDETGSGFAEVIARSALGLLDLSVGDAGAAADRLEPLLDRIESAGVREPALARFVPDLVEARVRLGRLDDAKTLLDAFEGQAVAMGRPSLVAACGRCRALLAAAETDFDAALAALPTAPVTPFEQARALLVRGGIERRARRKRAAREALGEALALFEKLGARAFAEQAHAELARIPGRKPAGDALTPTERRVAGLVAEGRSTKEVAASLFVSPKTVEGHLTNIYAKLGIHSRAALSRELSGIS